MNQIFLKLIIKRRRRIVFKFLPLLTWALKEYGDLEKSKDLFFSCVTLKNRRRTERSLQHNRRQLQLVCK